MRNAKYGLFIPFLNGMYDSLPTTATLIAGFEGYGYRANKPQDYEDGYFRAQAIFDVPINMESVSPLLVVNEQTADEPLFFDDVAIYHLEP